MKLVNCKFIKRICNHNSFFFTFNQIVINFKVLANIVLPRGPILDIKNVGC